MNNIPEGATHYRIDNNLYYKLIDGISHHCQPGGWIWNSSNWYRYLSEPGFTKIEQQGEKEMTQTKQSFTKSDLRTGMRVTHKNGCVHIVMLDYPGQRGFTNLFIGGDGFVAYDSLKDNLENTINSSYDIVKVETPTTNWSFPSLTGNNYKTVWERVEESETDKQHRELMEQIEELRKKAEALKPGGSK